jgi:hypothetical protein
MLQKIITLSVFLAFLASAQVVRAVEVPNFPTCSNPQGVLKVSYDSGTHGIVGNPGEFKGSDKMYTINDTQGVQCFCSTEGTGIQTNWWKIGSLTQDQIQTLKNLGWVFVPNGAGWGLDQGPYMAQNTNYSCGSTGTGGNTTSSGGSTTSTASATSSNPTPSVLGLATTGDTWMVGLLAVLSGTSFALGLLSRRVSKRK